MDDEEKKKSESKFHKGGFDFMKFEKIAEMMRSCCTGEGGMMGCCVLVLPLAGLRPEARGKREKFFLW